MTHRHTEILQALLELCRKDNHLKEKEHGTIWRILYVECILKQKLAQPQYWVIDALDECYLGPELVPMLAKVMTALPVRIFLTSRDSIQDHRVNIPVMTKVLPEEISKNDTLSDIELYLEKHMDGLPADNYEDKQAMKNSILIKSNGCFLWVSVHRSTFPIFLEYVLGADSLHSWSSRSSENLLPLTKYTRFSEKSPPIWMPSTRVFLKPCHNKKRAQNS